MEKISLNLPEKGRCAQNTLNGPLCVCFCTERTVHNNNYAVSMSITNGSGAEILIILLHYSDTGNTVCWSVASSFCW